ncbi:MAG TPA: hypothetical protein VLF71_04410 [Candidatus Saccharimonadales bacterium]|nr:hypothetical protein [Candidatus Saccharimonadales bacterium]
MVKYRSGKRIPRRKGLALGAGVAIGVALVGAALLSVRLVHSGSADTAKDAAQKAVSGAETSLTSLKKDPKHDGLALSPDPTLRKLAEYENVYGGAVADRLMVFSSLPVDAGSAADMATDMSTKLQEFAQYHIKPLVVMEPTNNGAKLSLQDFAAGKYDAPLKAYFQDLKSHGVTDAMMGVWVHFPEANIPEWGSTDATLFKTNVAKAAQIQKDTFPGSQVSIMLNSQSFRSDDVDRNYGTFSSLLPYVQGLPKGLFSSFGLQGFPWISAANEKEQNKLLNPAQYLNANFAREAAKALGTKQIWLNTGTFAGMYTNDPAQKVTFTASQRQALLQGVLQQVKVAQRGGYSVAVNIFSYDGSTTDEATDWSYWHSGESAAQAPGQAVFESFAEQLYAGGAKLWIFDSD